MYIYSRKGRKITFRPLSYGYPMVMLWLSYGAGLSGQDVLYCSHLYAQRFEF